MSPDLDDTLSRLASTSAHPGLVELEERVLRSIASQPPRGFSTGATLGGVAFALALGIVSNAVPATAARAASPLAPFGAPSPLVPSSLLLEPR